jgi:hypothetical protein
VGALEHPEAGGVGPEDLDYVRVLEVARPEQAGVAPISAVAVDPIFTRLRLAQRILVRVPHETLEALQTQSRSHTVWPRSRHPKPDQRSGAWPGLSAGMLGLLEWRRLFHLFIRSRSGGT